MVSVGGQTKVKVRLEVRVGQEDIEVGHVWQSLAENSRSFGGEGKRSRSNNRSRLRWWRTEVKFY